MTEYCDDCKRHLPVIPGEVRASQNVRLLVAHVCDSGDPALWGGTPTIFHQSITFATGCMTAAQRAENLFNHPDNEDLWTEIMAEAARDKPHIICDRCGQPTSDFMTDPRDPGAEYFCVGCGW